MASVNKVIYGGNVLIDLTTDTVTADKLLKGTTAHDKAGDIITGTCEYDANTQDADATASEILVDKTAYVNGQKITGTMTDNGAIAGKITKVDGDYTVPIGYHDGSGTVGIDDVEKAKIIAANIKAGINILGVEGTYSGEAVTAQARTVTPATTEQTVLPETGYDYLSQVTVGPIPYVETANAAGGTTVTIG